MKINDFKTVKKSRVKEAINPALSFEHDDPEFAAKKRGMGYFDYSTMKREDFNDDDWYIWDPKKQQFVASYGAKSSTALDFRMRASFGGTYKMPDGNIAMRGLQAAFMPGIERRNPLDESTVEQDSKTLQMIESWGEFKETAPALKEIRYRRRRTNEGMSRRAFLGGLGSLAAGAALGHAYTKDQQQQAYKENVQQAELFTDRAEQALATGDIKSACRYFSRAADAYDNAGLEKFAEPLRQLSLDCMKKSGMSQGKGMIEGKKKRKKKSSRALSRYFFPGYGYYGGGESGEGGGEGGGESIDPRIAEGSDLDENLRDWFKDKWVRFGPDGKIRGDCARGSESEGKPKCLPQAKAHALGKKGRASAAARKRREDPNANRTGAAINVATKKKTNEVQLDEKCWDTHKQVGMKKKGSRMVPNCVPKESQEQSQQCPECGGAMYPETMITEKKDACYYKVKASAKVWPSAYASGRLVQCRKRGASNYGKKSESVAEDTLDEKWSKKYKSSIDCSNPKGFSQRAHCAGRRKNEDVTEESNTNDDELFGPRAVTGTLLDRQALNVANKLTTDKNLAKLNGMAHDSTIYRALERYFVKNNISTTIFNRVAAIVFKKLDKYGRRLSTDPRTQEQGMAEDDKDNATTAKKPGFIDDVKQGAEDYKDLWMMGATGRTPERWKTSAEKAAERGSAPGPQFPLKEGRMKEIAIEFQDYKHLPDMAFQSRYKISKRDWWNKYAKLIQGSGLGIGMDEARGKIKAKVVHPRPTRAEREHDRIRKERGLPNPSHYKTLGDKLAKEIAALRGDDVTEANIDADELVSVYVKGQHKGRSLKIPVAKNFPNKHIDLLTRRLEARGINPSAIHYGPTTRKVAEDDAE
jgi:hypothetical protein